MSQKQSKIAQWHKESWAAFENVFQFLVALHQQIFSMKAILSKDRTDGQTAFKESLSHGDYVRSYDRDNPAKNKMNDFSHSNKNCFREIQHSSHGPRTSFLVLNNSVFFFLLTIFTYQMFTYILYNIHLSTCSLHLLHSIFKSDAIFSLVYPIYQQYDTLKTVLNICNIIIYNIISNKI